VGARRQIAKRLGASGLDLDSSASRFNRNPIADHFPAPAHNAGIKFNL